MSLFGTMNTSVSGMNAQSNRLSVVGDNIANADTVGYKRSTLQFSSLLLPSSATSYSSGSVQTNVRHNISEQGNLTSTNSGSDLAIKGNGFFVVQDSAGGNYLTRAGSFRLDDVGNMVNAAGFTLMGYSYDHGNPVTQINGLTGMVPINLADGVPRATKTSNVTIGANLDARKGVTAAAKLPSTNSAQSEYASKTSVVAYDSQGNEIKYDVYMAKKADATNGPPATDAQWEISIYRADQAATGGSFPYSSGPLGSMTLNFNPSTGKVTNSNPALSITDTKNVPSQTIAFNFADCTNLASDFSPFESKVDGSKASTIKNVSIDTDGTVYAVYSDGSREPRYRIPLAQVASPDNLTPLADNVYSQSPDSGVLRTGFPGAGEFGTTIAGALEASNVDMANELTDMIQAQRNYTANSKVFQTGADLMDVLVNLKR